VIDVTPAQLYAQSLRAAHAQQSVHYDSTVSLEDRTIRIACDSAHDRGRKTVELRVGATVGRMVVIVVHDAAYVRADAFALRNYVGLDAAQARRYGGRWFTVPATAAAFTQFGMNVRLDEAFDDIRMPGPYSFAPPRPGLRVIASTYQNAGQPVDSTLAVRAGGRHLPVRQLSHDPAIGTISTTFSRWNERVGVAVPHGALPFR
jgi:hypothetical protein